MNSDDSMHCHCIDNMACHCHHCVRWMVVERGGGCWQWAVLGVVDGSGWWWLEDNHCLLLIMLKSNVSKH